MHFFFHPLPNKGKNITPVHLCRFWWQWSPEGPTGACQRLDNIHYNTSVVLPHKDYSTSSGLLYLPQNFSTSYLPPRLQYLPPIYSTFTRNTGPLSSHQHYSTSHPTTVTPTRTIVPLPELQYLPPGLQYIHQNCSTSYLPRTTSTVVSTVSTSHFLLPPQYSNSNRTHKETGVSVPILWMFT